jgi:hypothetical protein
MKYLTALPRLAETQALVERLAFEVPLAPALYLRVLAPEWQLVAAQGLAEVAGMALEELAAAPLVQVVRLGLVTRLACLG